MNKEIKTTYASTSSTANGPTLEDMKKTMEELDSKNLAYIRSLIEGVIVIPDQMGLMVPPNGYAVVVGKQLWERLQLHKSDR